MTALPGTGGVTGEEGGGAFTACSDTTTLRRPPSGPALAASLACSAPQTVASLATLTAANLGQGPSTRTVPSTAAPAARRPRPGCESPSPLPDPGSPPCGRATRPAATRSRAPAPSCRCARTASLRGTNRAWCGWRTPRQRRAHTRRRPGIRAPGPCPPTGSATPRSDRPPSRALPGPDVGGAASSPDQHIAARRYDAAMSIENISTPDAPRAIGPYSQAIKVTGPAKMVFCSGQIPLDAKSGEFIGAGDVRQQTESVMKILSAVLTAAGASFSDVVK